MFCEQWKKTHLLLPEMTQLDVIFLSNLITAICKGLYFANFPTDQKTSSIVLHKTRLAAQWTNSLQSGRTLSKRDNW